MSKQLLNHKTKDGSNIKIKFKPLSGDDLVMLFLVAVTDPDEPSHAAVIDLVMLFLVVAAVYMMVVGCGLLFCIN